MKLYKIELKMSSSYITPWQSDTLLGAICWQIKYIYGEEYLKDFLSKYMAGETPLILSNGYINNYFPKPETTEFSHADNSSAYINYKNIKKAKKINMLPKEVFLNVLKGEEITLVETEKMKTAYKEVITHNQISRVDNIVNEGQMFSTEEIFLENNDFISVYALIKEEYVDIIKKAFENLGEMGFGKKASIGKGAFKIRKFGIYDEFPKIADANGFVTLSNFVPSKNDPTNGFYKTIVKFGKLGREYANLENPFKKPLIMIKPGAVFFDDNIKRFYGRVVEDIDSNDMGIIHFGLTLALPIKIGKEPM